MAQRNELPDFQAYQEEFTRISSARAESESNVTRLTRELDAANASVVQSGKAGDRAFVSFMESVAAADPLYAAGYYLDTYDAVTNKLTVLERMHATGETLVRVASDEAFQSAPVLELKINEHNGGYGDITVGFNAYAGVLADEDRLELLRTTTIDATTGTESSTFREVRMNMSGVSCIIVALTTSFDIPRLIDPHYAQTPERRVDMLDDKKSGNLGYSGKLYVASRNEEVSGSIALKPGIGTIYIGHAAVEKGLEDLEAACAESRQYDKSALGQVRESTEALLR